MFRKTTFLAMALAGFATLALAQGSEDAMKDFETAHGKMMQGMMAPMSGDPDKDFVRMMIPHHRGAIDMAQVELKYGKDPTLIEMAKMIVQAQEKEIADMKKWQSEHGAM